MTFRDNLVVEGDRNTAYFHKYVFVRRKSSRIISLKSDVGEEIVDPILLSEYIISYFVDLLSSATACSQNLWDDISIVDSNRGSPISLIGRHLESNISNGLFQSSGPPMATTLFSIKNFGGS